ncbi:MAG: DsbA family protein, partial [Bacteriovoracales bacterium]|nr:DsbA family protein [Bacteriovoracales bacterium]
LFFLSSMCPFCMGHWAVSLLVALLFWKKGLPWALPSVKILGIYAGLALFVLGALGLNIRDKRSSNDRLALNLMAQFERRPKVPEPFSPHQIHKGTENFKDAPLRLSEFSDFQCPSCLNFAEKIPHLIKRYGDKINIQYLFYPLDHHCNDKIDRPFHPLACQASFLAHCSGDKFETVHDEIFDAQKGLTQTWIDKKAQELGVQECLDSKETHDLVKSHLDLGNKLGVSATPTLIVNGKKIPGSLPLRQLYLLFDEILKRQ